MNEQTVAGADSVASVLLGLAWRLVRACAGTLCWIAGVVLLFRVMDWPYACVVTVACLYSVLAVWTVGSLCRGGRVRRVGVFLAPVAGDVMRYRRRRARRRGNQWLRESGLVHDSRDYSVFLWSGVLDVRGLRVVGVTEERLRDAVERSLDAWDVEDYEMTRRGPGSWLVRLYAENRLNALKTVRKIYAYPQVECGPGRLRVTVGRSVHGDVRLDLADVASMLFAGIPGTGKTAGATVIVAGLLSRPDLVDVHVFDGKGSSGWSWCEGRAVTYSRDDSYGTVLPFLRDLHALMRERLASGPVGGFWRGFASDGDGRAVCVVLDEIQTWTAPAGRDKRDHADADEFVRLATDIAKKGREAGIIMLAITQKPTTDALPSALRDMCAVRCCCYVPTEDMARAALGAIPEHDPSPTCLSFEDRGMAVMTRPDGGTMIVRFDYLSPDVLTEMSAGWR
ncbi:FtsK/SpoIIIE family protein [Bifidobacterium sp. DSM 109958]|uniref:FtsK/SpoIIIE family protein n=1 Tax=Bifidobacterium moraviense TaxID=2675323 RepID=A0A7Y0HZ05_9BIFI|nr:hypothetical protein [Bifidobacterium sp. DSM 109958]NMM99902.1 FtsK/SpoIIIE family protein [Bifidobacterium sp. DSM 109958]